MKQFRLFPEKEGFTPLIWMSFLLIPLLGTYPLDSINKISAALLIIVFALFYRNSLFNTRRYPLWFALQCIIAFYYLMHYSYVYLFMFPAWQIGFSNLSRRKFFSYYAALAGLIVLGSLLVFSTSQAKSNREALMNLVFTVFVLSFPFGGRHYFKQMSLRKQLYKTNQRLETLIKGEERNRIARDLHDTLGQSLSVMTMKLELTKKLMQKDTLLAEKEVTEVTALSRNTLQSVREIVSNMRQKTLLEELVEAEKSCRSANIVLQTSGENCVTQIPPQWQTDLSSCLREAVTNVIRHSKADFCSISFTLDDAAFKMQIKDNGIGQKNTAFGNGMKGLKERSQKMGGSFSVLDRDGTLIAFTIPIN